jgi:UDP-galactopyranose mutase
MHARMPALAGRARDFKMQLVRAAIAACNAILEVDPRARFVNTDPLMHAVAPRGRDDLDGAIGDHNERQFEAWDILCGRSCPHLGGKPRYLDIVGINYYWSNQWEYLSGRPLRWQFDDPRRVPLSRLLANVRQRYHRPLTIAETSHSGVRRANWLREIAAEVAIARNQGIPVDGVCLYPILDRPDWNNTALWHDCGLWQLEQGADGVLKRHLNEQYAAELRKVQHDRRAVLDAGERWRPKARQAPGSAQRAGYTSGW